MHAARRQRSRFQDQKINKQIYVLNPFSPFPKAWNQSFDWILSGFSPLLTIECIIWSDIQWIWSFPNRSKHFCARVPPARWAPVRTQKCFDGLGNDQRKWCIQSLAKGQIHWVFNQTIDFKLWLKGIRHLAHKKIYMCIYVLKQPNWPPSRPAGAFSTKYSISCESREVIFWKVL